MIPEPMLVNWVISTTALRIAWKMTIKNTKISSTNSETQAVVADQEKQNCACNYYVSAACNLWAPGKS